MRKIFAIAGVFLRYAGRSHILLILGSVILLISLGLPWVIKGDGTLDGRIQMVLFYNMQTVFLLLGSVILWISCGTIAREIQEKQIQLLLCKPVSPWHVWLGKWFGILILAGAMLLTSALLTTFALHGIQANSPASSMPGSSRRALSCHRLIRPDNTHIEEAVQARIRDLENRDQIPDSVPYSELHEDIRRSITTERQVVNPGSSRQWLFPARISNQHSDTLLSYRFEAFQRDQPSATGQWTLSIANGKPLWQATVTSTLDGVNEVKIPVTLQHQGPLALHYQNGSTNESRTVIFSEDISLLVPESSFAWNFFRTVLILFFTLAALAALGLTASALLSTPVALFCAISFLFIATTTEFFAEHEQMFHVTHHGEAREIKPLDQAGELLMKACHRPIAPAMQWDPLPLLSEGILCPWQDTLHAAAILLLGYPALLCALSGWILRKRQLALPDQT